VTVLEHDENIVAWAAAVRVWMQQQGLESAAIALLKQSTGLSMVKLWLTGLLGGLVLEQRGEIYEQEGVAIALR
jgi:hypothetical protein